MWQPVLRKDTRQVVGHVKRHVGEVTAGVFVAPVGGHVERGEPRAQHEHTEQGAHQQAWKNSEGALG